jgi:hypothetical protein
MTLVSTNNQTSNSTISFTRNGNSVSPIEEIRTKVTDLVLRKDKISLLSFINKTVKDFSVKNNLIFMRLLHEPKLEKIINLQKRVVDIFDKALFLTNAGKLTPEGTSPSLSREELENVQDAQLSLIQLKVSLGELNKGTLITPKDKKAVREIRLKISSSLENRIHDKENNEKGEIQLLNRKYEFGFFKKFSLTYLLKRLFIKMNFTFFYDKQNILDEAEKQLKRAKFIEKLIS